MWQGGGDIFGPLEIPRIENKSIIDIEHLDEMVEKVNSEKNPAFRRLGDVLFFVLKAGKLVLTIL